jgi:hypothetical protein
VRAKPPESGQIGRAVHVGHHLVGKGRPDLELDVAYRPRLLRRVRAARRRLLPNIPISGVIYDVETGRLQKVVWPAGGPSMAIRDQLR